MRRSFIGLKGHIGLTCLVESSFFIEKNEASLIAALPGHLGRQPECFLGRNAWGCMIKLRAQLLKH